MFRLACFTDEISQDLSRALDVCREFGLDGIELRSAWERGPHNFTEDEIARVEHLVGESGLQVACIAAPFYKCEIEDADAREAHLGILRSSIALAKRLGAPIVRGFTFWRSVDPDDALLDRIAGLLAEPARILDGEGATLGIENEAACHVGSAQELHALLARLDTPRIQAIWDPSNQVYMDDSVPLPFPQGYELLRSRIAHVHVKDSKRLPAGERTHTPVGEGMSEWPDQFAALLRDGYAGYCSLETHWRPTAELTEEVMNRPGGSAYTEGAEAGSRICLANIQQMLARLDPA
jgi:sugar phosphate isomerase/epimerase